MLDGKLTQEEYNVIKRRVFNEEMTDKTTLAITSGARQEMPAIY